MFKRLSEVNMKLFPGSLAPVTQTLRLPEVQIKGRKIKLFNIRKKMLENQKKYMLLHTDNEINNMDRHTLMQLLQKRKGTHDYSP